MPEPTLDPHAIIQKLTTEPVRLQFMHQYAQYDDHYRIWYQPKRKRFYVRLDVSVWDGRGHETYKEHLDEATLRERLAKIKTEGAVRYLYYEPR